MYQGMHAKLAQGLGKAKTEEDHSHKIVKSQDKKMSSPGHPYPLACNKKNPRPFEYDVENSVVNVIHHDVS